MHLTWPLYKHLSRIGASKKNEHITLMADVLGAFEMLNKSGLKTPVLSFADFNKLFLLETDTIRIDKKQTDGLYHLVAYMSHSLNVHECNYHLTKQEFLALKWVIMKQFQEYLL